MTSYIHRVGARMSQRSTAFAAIVGLHIALLLALTQGLVFPMAHHVETPITLNFPEIKDPPLQTPAPPRPVLQTIAIPAVQPTVPIDYPPETPAGSAASETRDSAFGGATAGTGALMHARIGKNFPDPDSFYPPSAIREELEGKAVVRVCVGPDGKLAEAPQIARSTRNRLLDEAALRLARAGHYVAGSRDGVPITDCLDFQATFHLRNAH